MLFHRNHIELDFFDNQPELAHFLLSLRQGVVLLLVIKHHCFLETVLRIEEMPLVENSKYAGAISPVPSLEVLSLC